MTHQEAFEKVKTHLLAQGVKASSGDDGKCLYRALNGLKCAIGCLIPDEEYQVEFDDGEMDLGDVQSQVSTLRELQLPFLRQLQVIHDNYKPEEWAVWLEQFYFVWKHQGVLS